MTTPFEELADVDRVVHAPARLAILTALDACDAADFLYLQRITRLTKGNLNSHLGKLEDAGLVEISKRFEGRTPVTEARLTPQGRARITAHWAQLAELRRAAEAWSPDGPDA